MKNLLLYFLILMTISACEHEKRDDCFVNIPPNILFFQIKENGQKLNDSVSSKIRIFYIHSNVIKVYGNWDPNSGFPPEGDDTSFVYPASRYTNIPDSLGVLAAPHTEQGYSNFKNSIKFWYIEYPDGDIDTLQFESTKLNCDDALANRCHCVYPYTKVIFNGKIAPEVTDIQTVDGKPIFLFEK